MANGTTQNTQKRKKTPRQSNGGGGGFGDALGQLATMQIINSLLNPQAAQRPGQAGLGTLGVDIFADPNQLLNSAFPLPADARTAFGPRKAGSVIFPGRAVPVQLQEGRESGQAFANTLSGLVNLASMFGAAGRAGGGT